jgi:GT2 family glycosyltransferase
MVFSFITLTRDAEKARQELGQGLSDAFGHDSPHHSGHNVHLICVDGTKYTIFDGYDEGVRQAKDYYPEGEFLVFLHDDVELRSSYRAFTDLIPLLKKPMTGIIGVAGTKLMPEGGCWWKSPQEKCRGLVYHPSTEAPFYTHGNCWPHGAARFGRVAVVDGVMLIMSRRTFDRLEGFGKMGYPNGFHFYDMDISMRAHQLGLVQYVAPIPIMHRSPGKPDDGWEKNRQVFLDLYRKSLPLRVE